MGNWWERARCRGRHDLLALFVPDPATPLNKRRIVPPEIVELCAWCPVRRECQADAEEHGRDNAGAGNLVAGSIRAGKYYEPPRETRKVRKTRKKVGRMK